MVPELVKYFEDLSVHLRLSPVKERELIREMHTHLEDRIQDLQEQGRSRAEAVEEATRGFGRPETVAKEVYEVHAVGTWGAALLAATPYAAVFLLFSAQLWQSLIWLSVFMTVSVVVTLVGWWHGKPQWMYPWAGYALLLPLVSGITAFTSVGREGVALLAGEGLTLPIWALLGLLVYVPLAAWMLLSVMVKVIRYDWIFASLMLLPFPILARWMLSLQLEGNALAYKRASFEAGTDVAVAFVFLSLALLPIIFVRVRQRRIKIAGLVVAAPLSFLAAAQHMPGYNSFLGLLPFAVLAVAFLLVPAVVDGKVGRKSPQYRRALSSWSDGALVETS